MDEPHALYRMFDSAGRLLYVGITLDVGRRFSKHAGEKPWWTDATSITLAHFPDRSSALEAERAAVIAEKPLHNRNMSALPGAAGFGAGPVKTRTIRFTDDLWSLAQATASGNDERLPDRIREFVAWYAGYEGAAKPGRPPLSSRFPGKT